MNPATAHSTLAASSSCNRLAVLYAAGCTLLISAWVNAQALDPRTYIHLPVGQNFLATGYSWADGELTPAPSVPVEDINLRLDTLYAAWFRSLDLGGDTGSVGVAWARMCQEGSGVINGVAASADRCGSGDPSLRVAWLFHGAPAMEMAEFRQHTTDRVIGVSLKVTAPLGDYNRQNLINTGANRWTFKPEIGISNAWGNWSGDAALSARLFTDNDQFNGDKTLKQNPLYQAEAHLIYTFPRGRWISLSGNYYWGGRTEQDGVRLDDRQENSRIGIAFSWPLNSQWSLKLHASQGLRTNIGGDFEMLGAALQYRWGD